MTSVSANAARPRREIVWQRRISATRSVTERRDVYADVLLIDQMNVDGKFTPRQFHAAVRLYGLFLAAGLSPRSTMRHEVVVDEPEEYADAADDGEYEDPRLIYRMLLRDVGQDAGCALDALMHGDFNGNLTVVRGGLDMLGDYWGFVG